MDIKVPVFPESVSEGTLIVWHKKPGDAIALDEVLAEVETDKVVFEVVSPCNGKMVSHAIEEGAEVTSAQKIAVVEEGAAPSAATEPAAEPAKAEATIAEPTASEPSDTAQTGPAVRKLMAENNMSTSDVAGTGKNQRVMKEDVQSSLSQSTAKTEAPAAAEPAPVAEAVTATNLDKRTQTRTPMTRIRARIAERLLHAKQSTAMLTTFNEVNMQAVMDLRQQYKEAFEKKHQVKLGFMSFFVKATTEALLRFPDVNAAIEGKEMIHHSYCDIGIAVSTDRGLVVPVLRNAESMSIVAIEKQILAYGQKGRDGTLTLDDLTGGTFSITNGGVFGSMLSTPILNPPQSAILGMHNIQKRAVVEGDSVVVRPMMYLALSYDHRVIDGKAAVSFLRTIKELLEDPMRIIIEV